jgi:flavin-binding protein dodecin
MIRESGGHSRLSTREVGDRPETDAHRRTLLKVIDVVGSSKVSFSEAATNAVRVTAMSTRNVQGVEMLSTSADRAPDGAVTLYKVDCRISFAAEGSRGAGVGG